MNKTNISYLTHTWNPIVMRCTKVSPACDHCWHLSWAKRHAGNPNFSDEVRAAYAGDAPPVLVEHRLQEPIKMRKPARIGVQFMGDLFHEDVPTKFIADVWSIMYHTWKHTFQILTKRPRRMAQFVKGWNANAQRLPSNIHLGVTAENQQEWERRRDAFFGTPTRFRYISYEPAIGPLFLSPDELRQLNLVITGGETGPRARPMKPSWARGIRDQCASAGVEFHFKSWGDLVTVDHAIEHLEYNPYDDARPHTYIDGCSMPFARVGAKRAGHLLDGVEWRETG